jgi:hypothetical protein
MRWPVMLGVLLFASLPAGASAGQGAAGTARLALVGGSPLKVRGVRFEPAERVRVRVLAPALASKRVVVDDKGSFVLRFAGIAVDRCNGLTVTAVGSGGSRAALKLPPQPLCPPTL